MLIKKYIATWHEENHSGYPEHVLGSQIFKTLESAVEWVESCIAEDRSRAEENGRGELKVYGEGARDSNGVFKATGAVTITEGNGQTTYYSIEEMSIDDRAADCVEEVKKILTPGIGDDGKPIEATSRTVSARTYIAEHESEWLPMKKWDVDICFSPVACIPGVEAYTREDAENKVYGMIDDGSVMDKIDTDGLVSNLLDNVERVVAFKEIK